MITRGWESGSKCQFDNPVSRNGHRKTGWPMTMTGGCGSHIYQSSFLSSLVFASLSWSFLGCLTGSLSNRDWRMWRILWLISNEEECHSTDLSWEFQERSFERFQTREMEVKESGRRVFVWWLTWIILCMPWGRIPIHMQRLSVIVTLVKLTLKHYICDLFIPLSVSRTSGTRLRVEQSNRRKL